MTNVYSVFRIDFFGKWYICNFRFLKFSTTTSILYKSSESVFSENNHVLPESIVLMYSFKVQVFKKMPKTKVYALEDSLGVDDLT